MIALGTHPGRARGARRRNPRAPPRRRGADDAGSVRSAAIMTRSTGSARRSTGAGAGSTRSSAARACSGPLSPLHHVDVKAWDNVLAVNLTANWRLIRSLDPLLRTSAAGRAVFVTSAVGSRAETARLLGALRGLQGGARPAGAHLCRRDAQHFEHQGDARQSRPAAHPHARRGDARRRSCDTAHSGGIRPEAGRALFARLAARPASCMTSRLIAFCNSPDPL